MKYINVFQTEAEFNNVSNGLARPQLSLVENKLYCWPAQTTPTIEYVDLGLSVKWAKYNLGATHLTTSAESWYGGYYAWGETETKSDYSGTAGKYKWGTIDYESEVINLTKYNTNTEYGTVDNKTTLESDDDVIAATYGGTWRMPTKTELEALKALPNTWVTDYNGITGLNGRTFTGNGNTLFVPAAGYFFGSELYDAGSECRLWSSSLDSDSPISAWILYFYSDDMRVDCLDRCSGLSVRGVCE